VNAAWDGYDAWMEMDRGRVLGPLRTPPPLVASGLATPTRSRRAIALLESESI
jgi:hypothetical protein